MLREQKRKGGQEPSRREGEKEQIACVNLGDPQSSLCSILGPISNPGGTGPMFCWGWGRGMFP